MIVEKLVTEVKSLNKDINEIHLGDCAFQVYSPLFQVKNNEMLSINISSTNIKKKGDYGMTGTVYGFVDDKMFISCGGLIGILDKNDDFTLGTTLHLMFTKRKKRKAKS